MVHQVVCDALGLDRLEGARTNMQGNLGPLDAARLQRLQHALIEVQRSGRRSHRPWLGGKHRLVARLVVDRVFMRDVWRQRHMAVCGHQRIGVGIESQLVERAVFVRPSTQHPSLEAAVHLQHRAWRRLLADLHVRCHPSVAGVEYAFNQQFESAACGFAPEQPGFDHLRVVKDQQIARPEQVRKLPELAVKGTWMAAVEQA